MPKTSRLRRRFSKRYRRVEHKGRRGAEIGYVKMAEGFETDFLPRFPAAGEELLPVCADSAARETRDRELRGTTEAAKEHPRATRRLLVLEREPGATKDLKDIQVQPVYEWLLERGSGA